MSGWSVTVADAEVDEVGRDEVHEGWDDKGGAVVAPRSADQSSVGAREWAIPDVDAPGDWSLAKDLSVRLDKRECEFDGYEEDRFGITREEYYTLMQDGGAGCSRFRREAVGELQQLQQAGEWEALVDEDAAGEHLEDADWEEEVQEPGAREVSATLAVHEDVHEDDEQHEVQEEAYEVHEEVYEVQEEEGDNEEVQQYDNWPRNGWEAGERETVRLSMEALVFEKEQGRQVSWETGEAIEGLLRFEEETGRSLKARGRGAPRLASVLKKVPMLVGGGVAKGREVLGHAHNGVKEHNARYRMEYVEIAKSVSVVGLGLVCCVAAARVMSVAVGVTGKVARRVSKGWGVSGRSHRVATAESIADAHGAGQVTDLEVPGGKSELQTESVGCQADLGEPNMSPMTPSLGSLGFWGRRASLDHKSPARSLVAEQLVASLSGSAAAPVSASRKGGRWGRWNRDSPADVFGFPGTPESGEDDSDGSVADGEAEDGEDLLKDTRRNLDQVLSSELMHANTTRVVGSRQ